MARPRTVSDEAIHAATAEVMRRHGLQGTTLAAVAAHAGLSAAGLVQRFGSKRQLLLDFARRGEAATVECFTTARSTSTSPLHAVQTALAMLTAQVRERSELANNLSFLQLDLADEDFRALAAANARQAQAQIEELLREAVTAGELAATDTGALARTVYLTYNGVLTLWPLTGTRPLARELHDAVSAVLRPYLPTRR
ncbi:AcrR family transcriptional regulator [Kineococcus radiotolerans]|uniref:Transcriptional regulator, TetR family n=2 Tax=Kineococcus radiotolerans TaxID=131568 RepID=A6WBG9_KINRD|nr:TetR/AcrR family transcriptional regulator [Kineococcus radiotolerans]ABS04158.1 transcriptional regulator, TetR family [Kineococcus radiotolerans SRS30216 = ATCC BAA-149]MBB2903423.1 AcrR family transcriptional regulator [Kineococcus radiotolerans]